MLVEGKQPVQRKADRMPVLVRTTVSQLLAAAPARAAARTAFLLKQRQMVVHRKTRRDASKMYGRRLGRG
jgi:hypothetical protein